MIVWLFDILNYLTMNCVWAFPGVDWLVENTEFVFQSSTHSNGSDNPRVSPSVTSLEADSVVSWSSSSGMLALMLARMELTNRSRCSLTLSASRSGLRKDYR